MLSRLKSYALALLGALSAIFAGYAGYLRKREQRRKYRAIKREVERINREKQNEKFVENEIPDNIGNDLNRMFGPPKDD